LIFKTEHIPRSLLERNGNPDSKGLRGTSIHCIDKLY
jgi:hypothetical protein